MIQLSAVFLNEFGAELKLARARNRCRLAPGAAGYLVLSLAEINTLRLTGEVVLQRPIHPAIAHWKWCRYTQPGQIRAVHEEVAWYGPAGENALYIYADHRDWTTTTWTKLAPRDMPAAAVRFWVVTKRVQKMSSPNRWSLSVRRCDRPTNVKQKRPQNTASNAIE